MSTSFTLPRELMEAIELKARRELTNKSEVIRRALLNYLSDEERGYVLKEMQAASGTAHSKPVPVKRTSYVKGGKRRGK